MLVPEVIFFALLADAVVIGVGHDDGPRARVHGDGTGVHTHGDGVHDAPAPALAPTPVTTVCRTVPERVSRMLTVL
jgi:hypothetical protein